MSSLHRAGLFAAGFLVTSAAVAACAGWPVTPLAAPDDAGADQAAPNVPEGGASDAGAEVDASVFAGDACSSAGWCSVDIPSQVTFVDLWPLEGGSAVAISSREGRSSVVIYEDATWKVIHDEPFVLTSVWASPTEIWAAGGEPGHVTHGRRDGSGWRWTVHSIPAPAPVTVVWKSGAADSDDVYALADARSFLGASTARERTPASGRSRTAVKHPRPRQPSTR